MTDTIRDAFRKQAAGCRMLNSPLTAALLEGLASCLDRGTRTGVRVLDWPGDPLGDALPLRLTGGLHALARTGKDADLSTLFSAREADFASVLGRVVHQWDDWLYPWLDSPPQTNEVGRSGALIAGLMIAADRLNLPMELLEIGASAGLNLNLDRFHFNLGGRLVGPDDAAVQIAPNWTGAPPAGVWPQIMSRAGVDQNPLNVADDDVANRLIAYCWADQEERLARLRAAIATARAHPTQIEAGDAADWVENKLAAPQPDGVARIIMHSVFWQYVNANGQARMKAAINKAAQAATTARPFGWLSFEPVENFHAMVLKLKLWPTGDDLTLANSHPHGTVIEWLSQD
jgi:hypothetical protein